MEKKQLSSQEEMEKKEAEITEMLSHVKHRVLVFSGKGGVGKSTVASNLAMALSERDQKVGLLDVDIHGPDIAKMFGVEDRKLEGSDHKIVPVKISDNLRLISMANFLESRDTPIIWRGPMKMKMIQEFLGSVDWGPLDWLICDSPPGTGDEPLSVAQLIPATQALIVTTPQEVSLLDSRKAISFAQKLQLNILGIIENMSGFRCPHCNGEINLFKKGGGKKIAGEMNVPFLGGIPIDPKIVHDGDEGNPFILNHEASDAADAFHRIVDRIMDRKRR
jgi:Mrp family chromosome partitioning ATPase